MDNSVSWGNDEVSEAGAGVSMICMRDMGNESIQLAAVCFQKVALLTTDYFFRMKHVAAGQQIVDDATSECTNNGIDQVMYAQKIQERKQQNPADQDGSSGRAVVAKQLLRERLLIPSARLIPDEDSINDVAVKQGKLYGDHISKVPENNGIPTEPIHKAVHQRHIHGRCGAAEEQKTRQTMGKQSFQGAIS